MCDVYNKGATGTIRREGATRTISRIEGKVDQEKLLDTL